MARAWYTTRSTWVVSNSWFWKRQCLKRLRPLPRLAILLSPRIPPDFSLDPTRERNRPEAGVTITSDYFGTLNSWGNLLIF